MTKTVLPFRLPTLALALSLGLAACSAEGPSDAGREPAKAGNDTAATQRALEESLLADDAPQPTTAPVNVENSLLVREARATHDLAVAEAEDQRQAKLDECEQLARPQQKQACAAAVERAFAAAQRKAGATLSEAEAAARKALR